jgi:UDP-glucose 4-epimerase
MAVCLVIGGAGFLGSHLVEALVADKHVVRVLDNFTTGKMENLAGVMDAIELYPGQSSDPTIGYMVARGAELLFHFGFDDDPQGVGELNCPAQVLSVALQARVRRALFASSLHVYGGLTQRPADEEDTLRPVTAYGRCKMQSEMACIWTARNAGLETVCLRYFNVFGPRQQPNSSYAAPVRTILDAMLSGRPPVLAGDEQCAQDLIYVDDAVHAAVLAARAPRVSGKVYNIARGQPTTSRQIVTTLNGLLGTRIEPVYTGIRPSEGTDTQASVRRAEADLGFCAATDLRRGLLRCLETRARGRQSSSRQHPGPPRTPFSGPRASRLE